MEPNANGRNGSAGISQRSLRERALHAGAWSVIGFGISHLMRFATNLIMTRLLAPDLFGIMAIATVVIIGLQMLSDLGLQQSIVQNRRGYEQKFLNTAWTIQILRGILLSLFGVSIGLFLATSNYLGKFAEASVYADPSLPWVVAALSMSAIVTGFRSTKLFEASRNVVLGGVTSLEIVAQVSGIACMLAWAILSPDIWALVIGHIFSALTLTILSHVALPGTNNHWHIDSSCARELIHFGKWILLSSILGFLAANGDRLLLGGLVPPHILGLYAIAYLIFSSVDLFLTRIMSTVSFPVFSEIARNQTHRLQIGYYRSHALIAATAYLAAGTLLVSGQPLINFLYDSRYQEAGWMLELLAIGLVTVPFRAAGQYFLAIGKPMLLSHILAARVAIIFVFTPLLFSNFGLRGALAAIVAGFFADMTVSIVYMYKYSLLNIRKELIPVPALALGMLVGWAISIVLT